MTQDHIFIDLETSGPEPAENCIIEIAAIRTDPQGKILATYTDKIMPSVKVSDEARKVNGYAPDKWADAVSLSMALHGLNKTLLDGRSDKYVVVAHFAEFDKHFLTSDCVRNSLPLPFPKRAWIDTGQIIWPLAFVGAIKSRSLESICAHLGIVNESPHTAPGDCLALCKMYWAIMRRYSVALAASEAAHNKWGGVTEIVEKWLTGVNVG